MKIKQNLRWEKFFAIGLTAAVVCGSTAGCAKNNPEETNIISEGAEVTSGKNTVKDPAEEADDGSAAVPADSKQEEVRDFAKNLFAQALDGKNPVLSPVSAFLALSLAGEGAEGETKTEFQNVLGVNSRDLSSELMEKLPADREQSKVNLANSAWLDNEMEVVEEWLSAAKSAYGAQVFQTKLSEERTMRDINWWVEENTGGLIKKFLAEPLPESARLVLFNAIYFKGKWMQPFEATSTYDRPFTLDDGTVVNVPTMNLYKKNLLYMKNELCEGIVLSYRDSNLVFAAIKPADESVKVRGLYEKLDMEQIGLQIDQAISTKVNLHLPKFKVSFDRTLNDDLAALGMTKAFLPGTADFSGLGISKDDEPIYIAQVRQKAVFILDEEGTEAAAVTEIEVGATAAFEEEPLVDVDFHCPFLYMVFDKESNMPLFIGIMDDPSAAE